MEWELEFRVLGPIEILHRGETVTLGAARQEIVLAMLLLEAGRVVPVDRLIDALWADEPPPTAKAQLQIIISALRRLLVPLADQDVIVTRSSGYLIRIPHEALDLHRFDRLVSEATAEADQRPAEAVQRLRTALALWRGSAAMGVGSRIVEHAATRLNEWRLTTLEKCHELELSLGRHRDIIAELREMVAEHPLRERLRAHLMLALYRSGRQSEALETYRELRQILMDELGLQPSEEIRDLQAAILANSPTLALSVAPGRTPDTVSEPTPVPRQLPRAIADFAGREELIDELRDLLTPKDAPDAAPHAPVVILTGRAGVGKTALALHLAHLLRRDYPDGQLFAQLGMQEGEPTYAAGVLEQFLLSFGVAPAMLPDGLGERAAMYRSWLADRRLLVVLDDAIDSDQVMPFLPGSPGPAVIITTRKRLSRLSGVHRFEIGALDDRSAEDLLGRVIGAGRARTEHEALRTLARLCEGLPLALRIVGARLSGRPHWSLGTMVRRLEDDKRRLDELDFEGVSVRAVLSLSYESLPDGGKRLLRRLSLLGAVDFASWVAAPLLDVDVYTAEDMIEELVEARLVEARIKEDGSARFQLHDLVRIYAVEQLLNQETAAERSGPLRRLLACWLFLATEAHRRAYGGDFSVLHGNAVHWPLAKENVDRLMQDPIGWFRRERTALVAAVNQAARAGMDDVCWDLAMSAVTMFESGPYVDDWRNTHQTALAAVREAGNRRGEAAMLYSLGTLALTRRQETAVQDLEASLELFQSMGEVHGVALAQGGLAFADVVDGRYERALSRLGSALAGFRAVGDLVCEADALRHAAQIQMDLESYGEAERLLDEALVACRKLDAPRVTAQVKSELAELELRRGRLDQAGVLYASARTEAQRVGDVVGEAYTCLGSGIVHTLKGELPEADVQLRTASDLAAHTTDLLLRGRVLLALAQVDSARGHIGQGLKHLNEALEVFGNLGSAAVWRGRALELTGHLNERSGWTSSAVRAWHSALEVAGAADPALARRVTEAMARMARAE
jgi:DNA-binding SARP family transcriptional activator/tetratricopeptide (TPR) repeat protein